MMARGLMHMRMRIPSNYIHVHPSVLSGAQILLLKKALLLFKLRSGLYILVLCVSVCPL